jgi:hypothetical protein
MLSYKFVGMALKYGLMAGSWRRVKILGTFPGEFKANACASAELTSFPRVTGGGTENNAAVND